MGKEPGVQRAGGRERREADLREMKPEAKPPGRQAWGGASASPGERGLGERPAPSRRPTRPLGKEQAPGGRAFAASRVPAGRQSRAEGGYVGWAAPRPRPQTAAAHPPRGLQGRRLAEVNSALSDPVPFAGPAFPLLSSVL